MKFVDTGAFLGYYRRNDQYHAAARQLWPALGKTVTSNHVIAELANAMARQAGYGFTVERIARIYASPAIQIIESTREDELEALIWMRKLADQGVSFTDRISFSIMRRYRIKTAFTFDRHFKLAGFNVIGLK